MRASTLATLVPALPSKRRPALAAGIIRSTLTCVLCGHPQQGSAYSICPDCFAINPNATNHPMFSRWLKGTRLSFSIPGYGDSKVDPQLSSIDIPGSPFERFPRHFNIAKLYWELRRRNQIERAFELLRWTLHRTTLVQVPFFPSSRDWKVSKGLARRFDCSTPATDTYWRLFGDRREAGSFFGYDRRGNSLEVSSYPGETIAERFEINSDEAIRALEYGAAEGTEAAEIAATASSIVRDMLYRPGRINRKLHKQRVLEFLEKRQVSPETLDSTPCRRHRVFVGVRWSCGTYSYGMQRKPNHLRGSSKRYASLSFG